MARVCRLSSELINKALPHWALEARPSPPVLILGAITIVAPLIDGGTTQLPVFMIRTILFLSCLGWIVSRRNSDTISLRWSNLSPLIMCFLALAVASVAWTPYRNVGLQWVVTLVMYAVFFQIVYQGLKSFKDVRILVIVVLGMGAVQAALGIIQCIAFGTYRAHGTFFNPNFYATYLVAVLALVGGLLCHSDMVTFRKWQRATLWGLLVVCLTAFLLARSRGALLPLLAVLAFLGYMRFGKGVVPLLLSCIAAVSLLPNPIRERGLEVAAHDPFAYTRIDMWHNAMIRIMYQPWGSGLGMYKYVSFKSRFAVQGEIVRFQKRAESPHNEYLQMTAELGVAGLLVFLAGLATWLRQARRVVVDERAALQRGVWIGLVGAVSAILVHASVDSVFHEPALVLLLILAGAMVLAMGNAACSVEKAALSFSYTPGRALIGMLAVSILLILTAQPAMAWYAFEHGNTAARSGEFERSLSWYRGAIMVDPWNSAYHDALASSEMALFQQSRDPEWILLAVEEMKMSMALNALDGRSPFRLGTLYQLLGETAQRGEVRDHWLKQATDSYGVAVMRDPYSPLNYVALGKLQRLRGELNQARSSFSQALDYEPNYLPARALGIEVDVELGNTTAAREDYKTLLSIVERWNGKATTGLEQEFLTVDTARLKRLFPS
jgi:O-antigen ligase